MMNVVMASLVFLLLLFFGFGGMGVVFTFYIFLGFSYGLIMVFLTSADVLTFTMIFPFSFLAYKEVQEVACKRVLKFNISCD